MGNFKPGNRKPGRSAGAPNSGRYNKGGSGDRFGKRSFGRSDDKPLFQATCADCGKSCDVPFKPNGRKPVYCRDCFRNHGDDDTRSSSRPSFSYDKPRSGGSASVDLTQVNKKLDKILALLQGDDEDETTFQ